MTEQPDFARRYPDLAAPELGGAIVSVSDEFFAPARRLLSAAEPVFVPGRYDEHGKWMDGWESRRRRGPGFDYCVLRICPGIVRGVGIDTRHFTGNYPPAASLQACNVPGDPDDSTRWADLVPRTGLDGDRQHFFSIDGGRRWTHLRLNIFPDGGIARLRVYGEPDPGQPGDTVPAADLSSAAVGGRALACNDMHFGDMAKLVANEPAANMGDGWETRRRRTPGNDWAVLRLGRRGRVTRVEIDTAHFRGNYPDRCSLSGACLDSDAEASDGGTGWRTILPKAALGPDQLHVFERQLLDAGVVTHVRLDIFPDGGVARLRVMGVPADAGAGDG
jgi:allantoicase